MTGNIVQKASIKKFFARYGYYRAHGGTFFHRQLRQRLIDIGFKVLSVERLETHPVWKIRLKGNLGAQANLLMSQPAGHSYLANPSHLLERQLAARIQRILKLLGKSVRCDEIVVVRSGTYFQVAFVWPMGRPGVLGRSVGQGTHPYQVSMVLRRWLRHQRN